MKVLLVSPSFYGYYSLIEKEIIRQGNDCQVALYPHGFIYKLCSIIMRQKVDIIFINLFFNRLLKSITNSPDVIIFIKGSLLNHNHYDTLKEHFPLSKFILYLWDDIELDNKEFQILDCFNKVFSYSPMDCDNYGFKFRPMFFDQSIGCLTTKKNFDLYYIASYRKNRYDFICKIVNGLKKNNLKYKVTLKGNPFLILSNMRNLKKLSFFSIKSVNYKNMMRDLARSKCCIELCRPYQKSLSTRPFEAMGVRTKVVTTNENIKKYEFYNPHNVLVVDEENPVISMDWINEPFMEIDKEIMTKFTLQRFVEDLLSVFSVLMIL